MPAVATSHLSQMQTLIFNTRGFLLISRPQQIETAVCREANRIPVEEDQFVMLLLSTHLAFRKLG